MRNGMPEHLGVPEGGVLLQAQVRDMQACTALFTDTQRSLDLAQGPLLRALLDGRKASNAC